MKGSLIKPNKMQGWHFDKGHFYWPIFWLVQLVFFRASATRRGLVVQVEIVANKSVPCSASLAICLVYLHSLVHASLQKEIQQEEVLSCFLCVVWSPTFKSLYRTIALILFCLDEDPDLVSIVPHLYLTYFLLKEGQIWWTLWWVPFPFGLHKIGKLNVSIQWHDRPPFEAPETHEKPSHHNSTLHHNLRHTALQ